MVRYLLVLTVFSTVLGPRIQGAQLNSWESSSEWYVIFVQESGGGIVEVFTSRKHP